MECALFLFDFLSTQRTNERVGIIHTHEITAAIGLINEIKIDERKKIVDIDVRRVVKFIVDCFRFVSIKRCFLLA